MSPPNSEKSGLPAVVLLCGGQGRRLGALTARQPKPLVPIGGLPILEHILYLFYRQGFREFTLAAGFRAEALRAWLEAAAPPLAEAGVRLFLSDAGPLAPTGDRLTAAAQELGEPRFLAAYGDCLADIDLAQLLTTHEAAGRPATMTCVRPLSPFGVVTIEPEGQVASMQEKPPMSEWVNGGFFVLEQDALESHRPGEPFETGALPRLVAAGRVTAFPLAGYWGCMDTPKDVETLDRLCRTGRAPWPVPPGPVSEWPQPANPAESP